MAASTLHCKTPSGSLNFSVSPKFVRTKADMFDKISFTTRQHLPLMPAIHSWYKIPSLHARSKASSRSRKANHRPLFRAWQCFIRMDNLRSSVSVPKPGLNPHCSTMILIIDLILLSITRSYNLKRFDRREIGR